MTEDLVMAGMVGRLECDRYGVPQFDGQSELFEEYQERCWDFFSEEMNKIAFKWLLRCTFEPK